MVDTAHTIWRDFVTEGVPSSGLHQPRKAKIRDWGAFLESLTQAASYGNTVWFATKALLDADLAHDAETPAVVYADATSANNGIYIKSGASGAGSWGQILTYLPGYQFVTATDAGAGSANAIVATSSPRVAYTDGVQLIRLNISTTNTSSIVTVAFDGGAGLRIKTASNNDPTVGALASGLTVLGVVDQAASVFRLLSDQASAVVLAAAEAAKDAAETAQGLTETARDTTLGYRDQALVARDDALAAAEASGDISIFDTKADADTALGGLSEGDVVEVLVDESRSNRRTRYRVESSAYVFKLVLGSSHVWYVAGPVAGDEGAGALGDDGDDGLSAATALATLAAAAGLARGGDTVRLKRGCIWREAATFVADVTIEPYGAGERPIVSGHDIVSSFTVYSAGPAYNFTIDLPVGTLNRVYPGVWEDGLRLREYRIGREGLTDNAGVIAAVEANPGSFGFLSWSSNPSNEPGNWTAGTKTYIVHASDGGEPGPNGKVYEAYKRSSVSNGNGLWRDIRFHLGYFHDGLRHAMEGGSIERLPRHGSLPNVPRYADVIAIGNNPAYGGGGFFHSNPGTAVINSVYERCVAVGESDWNVESGNAFYEHGTTPGVSERDRMTYKDCEAYNVACCFFQDEVTLFDVVGFRARNCGALVHVGQNGECLMRQADVRGGQGGYGANSRFLAGTSLGSFKLRDSNIDWHANSLLYTSGSFGPFEAYDTKFVIRNRRISPGSRTFAQPSGALARMWLHRCRVICPNGLDYLIDGATSAPDVQVRETLVVGGVTGSRINGVATALADLDAAASAFVISREKAILRDDEDGVTLRYGVYEPGDHVFSGVVYSGYTNNPRAIVAVGDRIYHSQYAMDAWAVEETPTSHLRAVCFNSGGDGTCYIAVGDDGLIMQSDANGQNWSVVGAGVTSEHLRAVWAMKNASLVVAVGDNGTVLRSTDGGATWAAAGTPDTTRHLYGVASNRAGTLWVAAGAEGRVITSTDGDTWSEATVGTETWRTVFRAGQDVQFVIGADRGDIRTSADGAAWTARTSGTTNNIYGFAWGEGQIVALAQQRAGITLTDTFLVSADNGNTWSVEDDFLPFEGRSICGPLHPMYNLTGQPSDTGMGFTVVGESQATGNRARGAWSVRRILDGDNTDTAETIEKWLAKAV